MVDGFLIKKLLSVFVHVIPGVPLLLLVSLLCRRWWPRLCSLVSMVLVVFLLAVSIPAVSNHFVARLEQTFPPLQELPADTALTLVLGYGHHEAQGRPPNSVLAAGALSRLVEGVRLWQTAPATTLALSGAGLYGTISHAKAMKDAAVALGVPAERLITFDQTRDTADEIDAATAWINRHSPNDRRLVVVSSATHLPRAALMLDNKRQPYAMAPTDFLAGYSPWYRASSTYLNQFDRAVHEWVGMLWYHLRHSFQ